MAQLSRRTQQDEDRDTSGRYAANHALHRRHVASPAERFTVADGIVAVGTAIIDALFVASRRTNSGRVITPLLTVPIAGIVAIETSGYTRAAAISALSTSAGMLGLEATAHLTPPQ